jgi:hypothetical protein
LKKSKIRNAATLKGHNLDTEDMPIVGESNENGPPFFGEIKDNDSNGSYSDPTTRNMLGSDLIGAPPQIKVKKPELVAKSGNYVNDLEIV